jgi:hypothetical protein
MNKSIIETHPNAWDFGTNDKQLKSTENDFKLEYANLNEIAMGAPLGGQVFLSSKNDKVLIDNWCGGLPVWETEGQKVAIPKWTRTFWKGIRQQLLILDLTNMELTLFKRKFDVLDLRSFDKNKIYGYNSPKHKPQIVDFNIDQARIERKIKLTVANNA